MSQERRNWPVGMALRGQPELKQKILGNMSTRAAATLQEEMEFLGSVRLSKSKVQQQIVDIVRKLLNAGRSRYTRMRRRKSLYNRRVRSFKLTLAYDGTNFTGLAAAAEETDGTGVLEETLTKVLQRR